MGNLYSRAGSRFLWMKWVDAHGIERRASTETGDRAEAQALLDETERQEGERAPLGRQVGMTVRRFFEEIWLPQRKVLRPFAWQVDKGRLEQHFLPDFGDRVLSQLASDRAEVELLDWLLGLRSKLSKRDGKPLASRTVWNIASIVRVFFSDALERKKIARDPTEHWNAERHLPAKADKEQGWRQRAGFTLDQVVTLTTDRRIPEDRRVLYALRFLGGGLRPGEAANARWRDLDSARGPLWRLTIASAFNTLTRSEKSTKTGAELNVPVHPVLRAALEAWQAAGWQRFMGREPKPDDLLVPRQEGGQRRVTTSLLQFHADLEAVGYGLQRQYESRSTFRNLALLAGASEFHINAITHPRPQKASDFYTRLEMQWGAMCRAVECIDASAWGGRTVVEKSGGEGEAKEPASPLRVVTAPGYSLGTGRKKAPPSLTDGGALRVTPTGFEPMFST
ncbi:hypothetical protein AMPC_01090 [Anaeromyxobacter paludicola]|uniref:Tyr recombinase domain-containing protein n=1 Tax=Anaeromyxobacter paludicola TaxID=2918171 RepID=A0ABM7X5A5_9BACT|nr:hypothetical protein AMPC_01090 [Anaeromyxobacter paludicola]